MTNKNDKIHIGELIKNILKQEGRTVAWFADKLCCQRASVYRILKKPSIDTDILLRISNILNHDFFIYYSDIRENK